MKKGSAYVLLFGFAFGYTVGLLTAKRTGKETVDCVKKNVSMAQRQLNDKAENLKYDFDSIKETFTDTVGLYTGKDIRPLDGQNVFVKEF